MRLFHCDRPEHGYDCYHLDEPDPVLFFNKPAYIEYFKIIIEEGTIVTPRLDRQGIMEP